MLVNVLSLSIFLTLSFYLLVGVIKKDLWITVPKPGLGAVFPAERKQGWRAAMFGLSSIFLIIFGLIGFTYAYNIHYEISEIILSIVISSLIAGFVKYSEKKLPTINPFKTVIPVLVVIILVSYLVLMVILLQR